MLARPWLVGLLGVSPGASRLEVHADRVRMAIEADVQHYALLDIVEFDGETGDVFVSRRIVEGLAWRYTVQVFLVAGCVDREWVHDLADRARVVVRELP